MAIVNTAHHLISENLWYCNIVCACIQLVFPFFVVPGALFYNLALAFYMKSFWRPYLIIIVPLLCGSNCCFLLVRFKFRTYVERKFGSRKLFRAVRHEADQSPWLASMMISAMYIPSAIKNYLPALTKIQYYQFVSTSIPFSSLYSAIVVHTGNSMTKIQDLFSSKPFSERTPSEKTSLILEWLLLAISISILATIAYKIYKRLQNYDHSQKEDERKNELAAISRRGTKQNKDDESDEEVEEPKGVIKL